MDYLIFSNTSLAGPLPKSFSKWDLAAAAAASLQSAPRWVLTRAVRAAWATCRCG